MGKIKLEFSLEIHSGFTLKEAGSSEKNLACKERKIKDDLMEA